MIGVFVKRGYLRNHITCNFECDKACKISKYVDIKSCSCKKYIFGKLVSAREDEMLNTTENSFVDKKITDGKKKLPYWHCFIGYYMLIIISCHFYQLLLLLYKTLVKKMNGYYHVNVKMNNLKEIDIYVFVHIRITYKIVRISFTLRSSM